MWDGHGVDGDTAGEFAAQNGHGIAVENFSHEVPYVIIGGHAVTYHGYVRATEDTDIVFRRTLESESAYFN